jgi:demethylmenaquinone methyltransferase/2-methoxy-6-polyprenyl-1,4-benzoquinol methylase
VSSSRGDHARRLFDSVATHYEWPAEVLGLGQYHRWRNEMVAGLGLAPKARVLDVATGTGLVARETLRRYDVSVVGLDQSAEMIREASARRADGLTLVRGDGQRLPFPDDLFDAVTFTYLLRYVDDPASTLTELARVLRPGGHMASIEFGVPSSVVVRKAWEAYALLLFPTLAGALSPGWRRVGSFLGRSIAAFDREFPPEELEALWRGAGLVGVRTKRMSFGGGIITWGRKRG